LEKFFPTFRYPFISRQLIPTSHRALRYLRSKVCGWIQGLFKKLGTWGTVIGIAVNRLIQEAVGSWTLGKKRPRIVHFQKFGDQKYAVRQAKA